MKKFKRMATAVAALAMTAALALPMTVSMTAYADPDDEVTQEAAAKGSITIKAKETSTVEHHYEAYQIFSGKLEEVDDQSATGGKAKVLTGIEWGSGVEDTELLAALQENTTDFKVAGTGETTVDAFKECTTADDVAKALAKLSTDQVKKFMQIVGQYLSDDVAGTSTPVKNGDGEEQTITAYTISDLDAGYYLIKDADESLTNKDDAYTSYIVKVLDTVENVEPKSDKPTVDKQVWDEAADGETTGQSWGESADHGINESFQFKLTAKIPDDPDMDAYKAYKLQFNDTFSKGVTFEADKAIEITITPKTGAPVTIKFDNADATAKVVVDGDTQDYEAEGVALSYTQSTADAGGKLTVTIDNLLKFISDLKGATVDVVYNAHLNENASKVTVSATGASTTNENTVNLEYSNNPNLDGEGQPSTDTGKTPDDNVWVFTYEVPALKTDENREPLKDAVFQLKSGGEALLFYYDETLKGYVYDPDNTSTKASANITSMNDGKFNLIGLDAGTYILTETEAPTGYNPAADITVIITATHVEDADGEGAKVTATLTVDGEEKGLEVMNQKGASLPGTGGIGTTLFYVVGGTLVAGAGVTLITKKRMKKEEE